MSSNNDRDLLTPTKLVAEFKAKYLEALTDQISDLDLASLLLDSNFFTIRDPDDQEAFFATSTYLDTYLISVVPQTVGFLDTRLKPWAKEALEFSRKNIKHESFSEIFSSQLNYETILLDAMTFDDSGSFAYDYFQRVRIDTAFVAEALPGSFRAAVRNAARDAVRPALNGLSFFLRSHERIGSPKASPKFANLNSIKRNPSFTNEKGTIPFSEISGRFKISPSAERDQIAQYQPVVDRAIKKLGEARVIQRIGNKDVILASLLSEYKDEAARTATRIRVPVLWAIGIEIESRLQAQGQIKDQDEKLDEGDVFDLRRLMVSHNLYISCFKQAESLLKDIESSAVIYQRIDKAARHLPGIVLRRAINDEALLERSTAETISRSVTAEATQGNIESKGQVALRLGLLRGLLHAASGHLLGGIEKIISKTVTDLSSKVILNSLMADSTFTPVVAFLQHETDALIQLTTQAPIYFNYVKELLALLGLLP